MVSRIHLAALSALCLLPACKEESSVGAQETQAPYGTNRDLGDRARALGADTRDLLANSLESGIEQADSKLSELRQRFGPELEQASESTREGWRELKAELESARKDASAKLTELRAASAENFDAARQGFQSSYERLEKKIAEVRDELAEN